MKDPSNQKETIMSNTKKIVIAALVIATCGAGIAFLVGRD